MTESQREFQDERERLAKALLSMMDAKDLLRDLYAASYFDAGLGIVLPLDKGAMEYWRRLREAVGA